MQENRQNKTFYKIAPQTVRDFSTCIVYRLTRSGVSYNLFHPLLIISSRQKVTYRFGRFGSDNKIHATSHTPTTLVGNIPARGMTQSQPTPD